MNSQEFRRWFDDYTATFQETRAWIDALSESDQDVMLGHWRDGLAEADLGDALQVTREMCQGTIAVVKAYERSATPGIVATACRKLSESRRAVEARERAARPDKSLHASEQRAEWNTLEIFTQLKDCLRRGGDTQALARRLMPVADTDQPRYKCLLCRDGGQVLVWHPYAMHLAKRGALSAPGRGCYSNAVRCSCAAGEHFPFLAVYDARYWCVYEGSRSGIAKLVAFVAAIKPKGYEPLFDEYNNHAESY